MIDMKTPISFAICTCLVLCFSVITISAQTEKSWKASELMIEKLEKTKSGFNYSEDKVAEYTLPDIFGSDNGVKITSPELWNTIRRPEIVELFRKYVYGRPPETQYQDCL